MLKAVIFDMDGVIVDSDRVLHDIEQEIFKDLGIEVDEKLHLSWVGMPAQRFWAEVKNEFGLPHTVDELITMNRTMTLKHFSECPLEPQAGLMDFLDELKSHNLMVALASSGSSKRIELILKRLDLEDVFAIRITAQDVTNGKPEPEVFLKAAAALGVDPKECVVIEDATNGVKAAKAAGMKCVGFNAVPDRQDLSGADLIVSGFADLNYDVLRDLVG